MSKQFKQGYALLIGIDKNQISGWDLPDVLKDIQAMHTVLSNPQLCGYPPEHIKMITSEDATRDGILAGIDWLRTQVEADTSENTTGVLYYSGHGIREYDGSETQYYLIPYDVTAIHIKSTALSGEAFAEAIDGLTPQRLLVVLDCCHAGGIDAKGFSTYVQSSIPTHILMRDKNAQKDVVSGQGKGLNALGQGQGRAILSSSQGDQQSWMRPDGEMSIFTYHLIEALIGHAQPKSGATQVLVSDVMGFVTRHVPKTVRHEIGAEQVPDFQISGNFPIAQLLGGDGLHEKQDVPKPLDILEQVIYPEERTMTTDNSHTAIDTSRGGYNVKISNVGEGSQVAVGQDIRQTSNSMPTGLSTSDQTKIQTLLTELKNALTQANIPENRKIIGVEFIEQLNNELMKVDKVPDASTIKVAGECLLTKTPELTAELTNLFVHPIVSKMINMAGDLATDWVKLRFGHIG